MALTLGGATSDRITVTAAASINNLAAFAVIAWVFPTTLTDLRMIYSKDNGTGSEVFFGLNGTGGNVQIQVGRATSNANAVSDDTPLSAANTWHCIAASWDGSTAPKIYRGSLTVAMVERTYLAGNTAGSGAQKDDSARDALWGNDGTTLAFQGRMAVAALFNRAPTLAELQSWQFDPRVLSGTVDLKHFGYNGTGTQLDFSGSANPGAVTGSAVGDHVPLRNPWRRAEREPVPYTAAAATSWGGHLSDHWCRIVQND